MNAASRALALNIEGRSWTLSAQTLGMILLLVAVLASALSIVYVKDLGRGLFAELQGLQQARDSLQVERGQLMLEQNTWAAPVRVQAIAQQSLGMVIPASKDIMVVSVTRNKD